MEIHSQATMQHLENGFYKHNDRIIYYDLSNERLKLGAIINSSDCTAGMIKPKTFFEQLMAFSKLKESNEHCKGSYCSVESPVVSDELGELQNIEGLMHREQTFELYGEWGETVRRAAYKATGQPMSDSAAVMMLFAVLV